MFSCPDSGPCFAGLAARDTNHFDQVTLEYGFPRYGFGYGGIVFGNGIGLDMASSGGFLSKNDKDLFRIAAEIGGRVWLNTNGAVRSHYSWHPGVGFGPSFEFADTRVTMLAKAGIDVSNFGYHDPLPRFRIYGSAGMYVYSRSFGLGAEWLTRDGQYQVQADILYTSGQDWRLGVRADFLGGQTSGAMVLQFAPF